MSYSAEVAELIAIREGLKVASQLGLRVYIVETDASNIVRELNVSFPL